MLNNLPHARLAEIWCMSVMAIGACGIVSGTQPTIWNGAMLIAAGVLPPLIMLMVWRQKTPVAIASQPPLEPSLARSGA